MCYQKLVLTCLSLAIFFSIGSQVQSAELGSLRLFYDPPARQSSADVAKNEQSKNELKKRAKTVAKDDLKSGAAIEAKNTVTNENSLIAVDKEKRGKVSGNALAAKRRQPFGVGESLVNREYQYNGYIGDDKSRVYFVNGKQLDEFAELVLRGISTDGSVIEIEVNDGRVLRIPIGFSSGL